MSTPKISDERIDKISSKMKRYMSENRIRYADLAGATGLSLQTISNQLNMHRRFTDKTAKRWSEGFKLLGFPINESFLLTGEGPITDLSTFDPDVNHAYSVPNRGGSESDEQAIDNDDPSIPLETRALMKLIRIRRERNELYEHCKALLAENQLLKEKLAAIAAIASQVSSPTQ